MKVLKVFFAVLFSFFSSTSVFAADYWQANQAGLQQCESEVKGSGAVFYTPKLKNPPEKGDIIKTFSDTSPGCLVMYVTREDGTRGMATVAVKKGGIKKLSSGRMVWTECDNLVTNYLAVVFDSKQSELTSQKMSLVQSVQIENDLCDAQCQAVKACESKKGTLDKMNSEGKWLCFLPEEKLLLIQPVVASGVVKYEWKGWNDQGMQVPGATPNISVARPMISVTGVACTTGTCQQRPVFLGQPLPTQQALPVASNKCNTFVSKTATHVVLKTGQNQLIANHNQYRASCGCPPI